jgi:outer membrane protein
MKRFFQGFVAVIFAAFAPASLHAQSQQNQKFGYVDSEAILSKMPQYTSLSSRLDGMAQAWRDEAEKMQKEVAVLEEDFKAKEILFTKDVRDRKLKEIDDKLKARQQFIDQKFGPQGEYFKQQKELLLPVQQKLMEAVTKVAMRDGFDFVFDRTGEIMVLYARPNWNITSKVLTELGLETGKEQQ